ncbi:MAG: DoxX family protein [Bacteroidota bacterium]|nr:DoxX family protein [Bacteroidota bacterium]
MKKYKLITIYILGSLYIFVGISHFINLDFFIIIMPEFIPYHLFFIYLTGFLEIIFGLMIFFKRSRFYGAWGIFILLILVFPANIHLYMSSHVQETLSITKLDALIRLPFQIPLIILSFWHSKEFNSRFFNICCSLIFIPTIIYFLTL